MSSIRSSTFMPVIFTQGMGRSISIVDRGEDQEFLF
jgi:hypothetical protein